MNDSNYLEIRGISKTFPGVKALNNVSLTVGRGEIHALVGENGAGKSTLIKILSGNYTPDPGAKILINGEEIKELTPMSAIEKGIIVIYQDFSLFPTLTVAENIAISSQLSKKGKTVKWKEMKKTAQKAVDMLGVDIDINVNLETLSMARQQLVAIARALACEAKLIIMDEPTSTLSSGEVKLLFEIMRSLQKQGISILFVSHKLEELFEVSTVFTVIRDGQYIGTYPREDMDNDKLISMMVGRKVIFEHHGADKIGETILEVKGLSKFGCFKDVSFSLHKGEILSLTGLVGAGRTEVVQAICGIDRQDEGQVIIEGEETNIRSMGDAIKYGIGYVPESRLTEGLVLSKSVADNITLTILKKLVCKRNHLIDKKKQQEAVLEWIDKLTIKPGYPDMEVQKLSGGNQQRIVIAKWLATNPKILIVDEPTNGIDVGAKSEIHNLLRLLASQGMGILMVSSEMTEVLSISDRVLVMRRGRINGEFDGAEVTQEILLNAEILSKSGSSEGKG